MQSDVAFALRPERHRIIIATHANNCYCGDLLGRHLCDIARISAVHTRRSIRLLRRDALPLTEEPLDELRRGRRPQYRPAENVRLGRPRRATPPQRAAPPPVEPTPTTLLVRLTRNPAGAIVPLWRIPIRALAPMAIWVPAVAFIPVVFSFVSLVSEKVSAIVFAGYESGTTSGDGPWSLYLLLFWGAVTSSAYLAVLSVVCNLDGAEWTDTLSYAVSGVIVGFSVLVIALFVGEPDYKVWLLLPCGACVVATYKVMRKRFSATT